MKIVKLKVLPHRGSLCIGIYYETNHLLNTLLVRELKAKWSNTNKCWYIVYGEVTYSKLLFLLKQNGNLVTELGHEAFKNVREIVPIEQKIFSVPNTSEQKSPELKTVVDPNNSHIIRAMKDHLVLKAYSVSTIKTYLNEMQQFLYKMGKIPADDLKPEHLKRYFVYCFEKLKLSENTLHSRMNAIKFYFEQVLHREKFFWEIPRPKKALQLPRFFSQDDIVAIIHATENLKHKLMLMLAYSAGLRVSEVVTMKTYHINISRMSILVERAKGKKDRMVGLSAALLVMLREYIKQFQPNPKGYLFEGQAMGEPYTARSMQLVLASAKVRAGIMQPGSVHALRHSFATHLLDKGTDVTLIMKLLGHNDIKTTMRYLHITNRDILQIISPLDDLNLG